MNQQLFAGNIFNKYDTKNPIIKYTVSSFISQIKKILHTITFDKLLDIGCGEGYLIQEIQNEFTNTQILATDISFDILSSFHKVAPNVPRHCCSVYSLPFKDNSWDVVIACEVLEHLHSPEKALKEIKRIGRSHFLFTVPLEPWWHFANIIRGKYISHWGNTPGHVQQWNKNKFIRLLEQYFVLKKYSNIGLWQLALTQKE